VKTNLTKCESMVWSIYVYEIKKYIGGMQVQSKGMMRSVVGMNGGEGKMKEMSNREGRRYGAVSGGRLE
jgi:hypothetical protein